MDHLSRNVGKISEGPSRGAPKMTGRDSNPSNGEIDESIAGIQGEISRLVEQVQWSKLRQHPYWRGKLLGEIPAVRHLRSLLEQLAALREWQGRSDRQRLQ